jgi:hypothetical protein
MNGDEETQRNKKELRDLLERLLGGLSHYPQGSAERQVVEREIWELRQVLRQDRVTNSDREELYGRIECYANLMFGD